jgi:putative membrane protein
MVASTTSAAATLSRRALALLLAAVLPVLVWSGIAPHDRATWWLEVAPVLIVVPLLLATRARFPLSPLLYGLIAAHAIILMIGGHYTYARVPLGLWAQDAFDLARNHYDRLGHLAQGFVPAIAARELLLRTSPLGGSRWLPVIVVCMCLAISACYEFLEWWTALIVGGAADAFLATQGDVWDTQWDMLLATIGAITALALLARAHDRSLARVLQR